MEDLGKVNSWQLYRFWKDLSINLLVLIAVVALSKMLPAYLSPVIELVAAAMLYTKLYNARATNSNSCMILTYTIFVCLVSVSFVSIALNVLNLWNVVRLPRELSFFNEPYLPILPLAPVCFIVVSVIYLRRANLNLCVECRMRGGSYLERGKLGRIMSYESRFQLRNLMLLFGVITVMVWTYYLVYYVNINVNQRDWYVFLWLTVIAFLLDEGYFAIRYYNLYLDLEVRNELITPEDIDDIKAKTYLRYYLICGDMIFLDPNSFDATTDQGREVIDTPFMTKRMMQGVAEEDVKRNITRLTGVDNGELRFFFGRRSADAKKQSLMRYFYFLDGKPSDYTDIRVRGEWMPFSLLKEVYSKSPELLAPIFVGDITRMATIVLTNKIFDESGERRLKIKSYQPSFDLIDVRRSGLDFQNDKWIRISMFNSDTRFFKLRRWWRRITSRGGGEIR